MNKQGVNASLFFEPLKSMLKSLAQLVGGVCLVTSTLLLTEAHASRTEYARVDYSRAMPEERVEDMSVKVLGGEISISRFYRSMRFIHDNPGYPGVSGDLRDYNGNSLLSDVEYYERTASKRINIGVWQFHRYWHDLLFIDFDAEAVSAQLNPTPASDTSGVVDSTQSNLPNGKPLLPGPAKIDRNDYMYVRKRGENYYVYEHNGNDLRITLTATGFRWSNREGEWIEYDAEGFAVRSGDKNGVSITLVRNGPLVESLGTATGGLITEYRDHLGQTVVRWEYKDRKPVKAIDYQGRVVEYKWDDNELIEVTTTRGHKWAYGYGNIGSNRVMTSKTDPEGQTFLYNHALTKGGFQRIVKPGGTASSSIALLGDNVPTGVGVTTSDGGSSPSSTIVTGVQQVEPTLIHTDMIYPDGKRVRYQYLYAADSEAYMIYKVDSDGVESERWYDLDGQIRYNLIDGKVAGIRLRNGRAALIQDPYGHRTRVSYNRYEAMQSISYPDGSSVSLKYLPNYNFPTLRTDQMGVQEKHEYDFSGNRIRTIYGANTDEPRTVEYQYDAFGQPIKVTQLGDANTPTSMMEYQYDDYGNVTQFKDGRGNITQFKDYNSTGQYQTYIDARGETWAMTYDMFGNRLSSTSPLGFATRYEYDTLHRLIAVIDPENRRHEFKYDSRDNLIESADNLGGKTKLSLRMDGRTKVIQDETGRTTSYGYDRVGRMTSITDAVGNVTSIGYLKQEEIAGERPEKIDGPNTSLRMVFDPLFRLTELTQLSVKGDDLNTLTSFTYNARGERTSLIDPNEHSTHWSYNPFGQLATATNAEGEVVKNAYDARGNLKSVMNALNQVHRFEYDANSNLTREYRPMGEVKTHGYDANNNLTSSVDFLGNKSLYTYDSDSRMVRETNTYFGSTVAERLVEYTLDKSGLSTKVEDENSSVSYIYDGLSRLLEQTTVFQTGGLPIIKTLKNSYYANGELKSRTDAEGNNSDFYYDAAGKFKQLNIQGAGAISVSEYEGDLIKSVNYPGGIKREHGYDGLSRLKNILVTDNAENTKLNYGYTHDKVGNIIERTTQQGTYAYQYDKIYRLISAEQPSIFGNQTYTYDNNGSRTRLENEQGIQTYSYNGNNELTAIQNVLDSVNTSAFMHYDANGALLSENIEGGDISVYEYNSYGRLNRVEKNAAEIATYKYDPQGRRLSKNVSGETTYFLYDDTGVGLVGEYDESGNLIRGYSYSTNSLFSTNPVTHKTPQTDGGYEFDFYQNDHLGTSQLMIATSGATTWQGEYDAFGKAHLSVSEKANPLRFAGQYFDGETENHQNWHRDYSPTKGRYVTSDPIGLAGGLNTYTYVGGNPLMHIDPSGLVVVQAAGGIAGAGVSAAVYWEDFRCGRISVWEYMGAIGIGAGAGFISGGVSVYTGAGIAGVASVAQQVATDGEVDGSEVAIAVVTAGVGGKIGGAVAKWLYPSTYKLSFKRTWHSLWLRQRATFTETYDEVGRQTAEAVFGGSVGGGLSTVPEKVADTIKGDKGDDCGECL